ncbi:putative efflux protein, MATE family [Pseudovibrio denitrificans]|uniref:Multidrug export protein MepA n=1 Tax=Pseudovibrio denitrificans TaxID=258256 RepID=A0A1I7C4B4_9HYPH|nr:MATE family efflux transporter [Pseudovibrio denitrificans]SFT94297.1 putative efflux protein, MATE family [Pseudovibrio denitrificans]
MLVSQKQVLTGAPLRQFLLYAIPSTFSLLALAIAEIVDAYFLGNYVGPHALEAVNFSLPIITAIYGLMLMIAVGASVITGKYVGEGKEEAACQVFIKTLLTTILLGFALTVLILVFIKDIVELIAFDPEASDYIADYLKVFAWAFPLIGCAIVLTTFGRIDGRPALVLLAIVLGTALNVPLDHVLVAELEMGVTGAAIATGSSQVVVVLVLLPHLFRGAGIMRLLRPDGKWRVMLRAAYTGLAEFINEISTGVIVFVSNWILILELGTDSIVAFGMLNYLVFLSIMIFYGFGEALGPLISINLGAHRYDRIKIFLFYALSANLLVGGGLAIFILLFPVFISTVFLNMASMMVVDLTEEFSNYLWPIFIFNGINITLSCYFVAIQSASRAAIVALSRSLVFPVIFMIVFHMLFDGGMVILALPLAEIMSLTICLYLFWQRTPGKLQA